MMAEVDGKGDLQWCKKLEKHAGHHWTVPIYRQPGDNRRSEVTFWCVGMSEHKYA